jgi:hypothetical protein
VEAVALRMTTSYSPTVKRACTVTPWLGAPWLGISGAPEPAAIILSSSASG